MQASLDRFIFRPPARVDVPSFPKYSGWLWDPHVSHFVELEALAIQINSQNLKMAIHHLHGDVQIVTSTHTLYIFCVIIVLMLM
jgi:hypothetical protein